MGGFGRPPGRVRTLGSVGGLVDGSEGRDGGRGCGGEVVVEEVTPPRRRLHRRRRWWSEEEETRRPSVVVTGEREFFTTMLDFLLGRGPCWKGVF